MSKRVLAILMAVLMAIGIYSAVASAGVEGSFTFDISLKPQTTVAEVSKFDIDFEGLLDLYITVSGLTFSHDLAFGVAGIEHYIANLETTLGALDLRDEFWFAAPYDEDGNRLGDMQFVKKKVEAEMTIGGLTVSTLALFEDINFTHPYEPPVKDPVYRFGVIFTVSGATVSGIGVESITGICADPQVKNKVKKYWEYGRVCENQKLEFTVEKINITGIPIAGVIIDSYTEFRPGVPIAETIDISFTVMGIDMLIELYTEDITTFSLSSAEYTLATDYITVIWSDKDGDLTLTAADEVEVISSVPVQAATFSNDIILVPTKGITKAEFGMEVPVVIGTLSTSVTYVGPPPLAMDEWSFALSTDVAGLGFVMDATFGMAGLESAGVEISVSFSA